MCFSFKISISTFIFSWVTSLYLLYNRNLSIKNKNNIYFLLILSSIQLVDAVLWYINMKKNNINYFVTSIILPLLLILQVYFNLYVRNNLKNSLLNIVMIIGSIYLFYRFNGYSTSLCNNNFSSPIWASNEIKLWEFIIFTILIFYPYWKFIIFIILVLFPAIHIVAGGAYGSLWCFVANSIAIYYLITL